MSYSPLLAITLDAEAEEVDFPGNSEAQRQSESTRQVERMLVGENWL